MILNRVDPLSAGRIEAFIQGVVWFVIGIIFAVILALASGAISTLIPSSMSFVNASRVVRLLTNLSLALPIIALVFGLLYGMMSAIVNTFLYNFAARKVGGINLNFSKDQTVIQSIGIISFIKVYIVVSAIVLGLIGLIIGAVIDGVVGLILGLIAGVIIGAIAAIIFGAIFSFLYNLVAGLIGGIKLQFAKGMSAINSLDPLQLGKVVAVLELIFSIIEGIFLVAVGVGVVSTVIRIIISTVFGFVIGIIIAFLYNFAAKRYGGVQVWFSK